MPVTRTRKKVVETTKIFSKNGEESKDKYLENLAQVPCIWYPITFWKKFVPMLVFFDSDNEFNTIYPTFTQELGIRPRDIKAQKIDSTILDIFRMVVVVFLVIDKVNRIRFFE